MRPLRVGVLCSHRAPGLTYLLNQDANRGGVAMELREESAIRNWLRKSSESLNVCSKRTVPLSWFKTSRSRSRKP